MQIRQCDRCKKTLDQSYEIPFHLRSTDIGTKTLCKPCVERLKRILVQFWKVREETTREKVGDTHFTKEDYPYEFPFHLHGKVQESTKIKERKKGYQPSNIFTKLIAMLFFQKVEEE